MMGLAMSDDINGYQAPMRFDLGPLQTRAEVFAFVATKAREQGQDEVAAVDALVKATQPFREDIREVEQQLRALGYIPVADHLRKVARRLPLRPPCKWPRRPDLPDHSWRREPRHGEASSSDS